MNLKWTPIGFGLFGVVGIVAAFAQGAGSPPSNPKGTTRYNLVVPPGFPPPPLPTDNILTVEGVALGLRLFHETKLSGNNTQSCASCHTPQFAFSNEGKAVSTGITGATGTRNAPGLFNLAYQHQYFWDGRASSLRAQALAPIQNPVEMDQTLTKAVANLSADPTYVAQFAKVFGSAGITSARIGLALEQYELTLMSGYSKFDLAQRGLAKLTAQEQRGFQLFQTPFNPRNNQFGADCTRCHGNGPILSDFQYRNNGLDAKPTDAGREVVTGSPQDFAKFKTPSLRNLSVTGPYMHDGRFTTLEEVVAHYSDGILASPTLDPGLARQNGGVRLTPADEAALVAFLKTLTDNSYLSGIAP